MNVSSSAVKVILTVVLVASVSVVAWLVIGGRDDDADVPSTSSSATTTEKTSAPAREPTSSTSTSPVPSPSLGTPSTRASGAPEPIESVPTKKAVALDEVGDFGAGLTVRITDVVAVKGVARSPGEVAGPAVSLRVSLRNRADGDVPLDKTVVSLAYGKAKTPAVKLDRGTRALPESIPSGGKVDGSYVFSVPDDERNFLRVEISYSSKAPTVAFEGPAR